MSQQDKIRELDRKGYTPSEIKAETGFSYPTIRKYRSKDDFSPERPVKEARPSKLDPYVPFIEEMLDEDRGCYRKQHHTATRIDERLRDEHGWEGSYSTVQRRVKQMKARRKSAADQYNDLEWPAGSMQVDFGQADFDIRAKRERMHFLPCSFPQSNHALVQVFGDEKAVCVVQGLKDVFEHIGGVPPAIVFDNATEVGRRMCGIIRESGLFRAFRMHYGFEAVFCNPYSGHEKGNVENKVRRTRLNDFVPVPEVDDLAAYNAGLLAKCDATSAAKKHYEKGLTWAELFEADRAALLALPAKPFDCVDWKPVRADKYGKVALEAGKHKYLAHAGLAGRDLVVGVRALSVEIWTAEGEFVRSYERRFGDAFTNDEDPVAALDLLRLKPRAFSCSSVRSLLDKELAAHLDAMENTERGRVLGEMRKVALAHGFKTAASAFAEVLAATGGTAASDVEMTAVRIACGAPTPAGTAKLIAYDELLRRKEAANG